jgi:hypothetical protein
MATLRMEQEARSSVPIAFDHHGMVLEFLEWFEAQGRERGLYVQQPHATVLQH